MKRVLFCFFGLVSYFTLLNSASAEHICWVESVKPVPGGVSIIFTSHRFLNITVKTTATLLSHNGHYLVEDGLSFRPDELNEKEKWKPLFLLSGDSALISGDHHSHCSIEVSSGEGGVEARLSTRFSPFGGPPVENTEFIRFR